MREWNVARQAHKRASVAVERLQRRVNEVAERLNRMPALEISAVADVDGTDAVRQKGRSSLA
jgi:hypothetical protein